MNVGLCMPRQSTGIGHSTGDPEFPTSILGLLPSYSASISCSWRLLLPHCIHPCLTGGGGTAHWVAGGSLTLGAGLFSQNPLHHYSPLWSFQKWNRGIIPPHASHPNHTPRLEPKKWISRAFAELRFGGTVSGYMFWTKQGAMFILLGPPKASQSQSPWLDPSVFWCHMEVHTLSIQEQHWKQLIKESHQMLLRQSFIGKIHIKVVHEKHKGPNSMYHNFWSIMS